MKKGFDHTVLWYDWLAKLVFGRSIRKAQTHFFHCIPDRAHVLILGGGTGWILEELFKVVPDSRVTYVEASAKMLERSKKRAKAFHTQITFIKGTEADISSSFDTLITPFVLDVYPEHKLPAMMKKLKSLLKPEGQWLFTDFTGNEKFWQKVLLKSMYLFFDKVSGIESRCKPDYDRLFTEQDLKLIAERKFYGQMISARQYKK